MKGMKLALVAGVMLPALLALSACTSESKLFDNNCSGNGKISNPSYCTGTLKPYAGPWSMR